MASNNHFEDVITNVQQVPQNQRTDALITGIAQQMQTSGNPQLQQWGTELQNTKTQLVKACQQGG